MLLRSAVDLALEGRERRNLMGFQDWPGEKVDTKSKSKGPLPLDLSTSSALLLARGLA